MAQKLKSDLAKYHGLFNGGRCSGWELEELIVNAIKSDTKAQQHLQWREAGHDDKADIKVLVDNEYCDVQIKSGQIKKKGKLTLSGYRLGRHDGDMATISAYLNSKKAAIITVPYRKIEDERGRQHCYRICYIDASLFHGLSEDMWVKKEGEKRGKKKGSLVFKAINKHGVEFSIHPSMSWQIWWQIPIEKIEWGEEFTVSL